jgi:hypothetical protein
MVIETYLAGPGPVYERFREHGRLLPEGLEYIDSWIDADHADRCFQLMATDDPSTFAEWTRRWDDLVAFEIIPVVSSGEASKAAG